MFIEYNFSFLKLLYKNIYAFVFIHILILYLQFFSKYFNFTIKVV